MFVDAHHHLWDLSKVDYPWLMERGATRFFGDPTPIQRNYLLDEHISQLEQYKFNTSIHVQVGALDAWQESKWVDQIAANSEKWNLVQVAFCDFRIFGTAFEDFGVFGMLSQTKRYMS